MKYSFLKVIAAALLISSCKSVEINYFKSCIEEPIIVNYSYPVSLEINATFTSSASRLNYLTHVVEIYDFKGKTTLHQFEKTYLGREQYRLTTQKGSIKNSKVLCGVLSDLNGLNSSYQTRGFRWTVME